MIKCKVTGFAPDEIHQAVRIQIQELNQGFLSSLGEKPLQLIFAHVASSRWGVLVLAVESEQGQVVGYVFGATDTGQLYKEFLLKRTLSAAIYFVPKLLSWQRIKKAFETLMYPTKKRPERIELPKPELLDLAVTQAYQGTGIAQELFKEFVKQCRNRGVTAFQIPTTEGLNRAHRFYEKMGAYKVTTIEVHQGQKTYIYQFNIQEQRMIEQRSVPFFNYPYVFTSQEDAFTAIFQDVGRRGAFIAQQDLRDFEQHLAAFTGARHALGFSNATDGLHIALRAAGIGPGDEVIFCSHTMVATAAAIHFAGATPVPVECGPDHLMDPAAAAAAVTLHTRALMPTQLNGRTCDMDALQAIADRHGLLIVEDAAQALGSRFKGKQAGTFGIASAISFYPAKNLGCLGDGGAVLTNDDAMHRTMFLLRDHGRDETGEVVMWGLNTRLDNLQAAILDFKLARYDEEIARRREIAALYQRLLGDVAELVLPPAPDSDPDHFDVFQNYEIEAERRDDLKAYLKERDIGTLIQWGGKAVHQFKALGFQVSLPNTERMFTRCLMLPMNRSLSDDDVQYVCQMVRKFYGYAI